MKNAKQKAMLKTLAASAAALALGAGMLTTSMPAFAREAEEDEVSAASEEDDDEEEEEETSSETVTIHAGTFTNTYDPDDASVSLTFSKELHDQSSSGVTIADYAFTFVLTDTDGNEVARTTNDEEGNVVFSGLTFDTVGTYSYIIYEEAGSETGITYDSTQMEVTVTVSWNSSEDALVANVSYPEDTTFDNYYEAASADLMVTAAKTLTDSSGSGRTMEAGEFTFALLDEDGNTLRTATNASDGSITFSAVTITQAGTYTYQVAEVYGTDSHMTYDSTVYTFTVVVTDNAGQLVIKQQ